MIYGISGKIEAKKENFVVIDTNGTKYKVHTSPRIISALPQTGDEVHLFTHLEVKEDALDLYGFISENELVFFEKLISVNGVGPRTALAVTAIAPVEQLAAAINQGKTELLIRVSGIGKKTADRIVLELKGKLPVIYGASKIEAMEADAELEDALIALGYSKLDAKKAIAKSSIKNGKLEERLKETLKSIK